MHAEPGRRIYCISVVLGHFFLIQKFARLGTCILILFTALKQHWKASFGTKEELERILGFCSLLLRFQRSFDCLQHAQSVAGCSWTSGWDGNARSPSRFAELGPKMTCHRCHHVTNFLSWFRSSRYLIIKTLYDWPVWFTIRRDSDSWRGKKSFQVLSVKYHFPVFEASLIIQWSLRHYICHRQLYEFGPQTSPSLVSSSRTWPSQTSLFVAHYLSCQTQLQPIDHRPLRTTKRFLLTPDTFGRILLLVNLGAQWRHVLVLSGRLEQRPDAILETRAWSLGNSQDQHARWVDAYPHTSNMKRYSNVACRYCVNLARATGLWRWTCFKARVGEVLCNYFQKMKSCNYVSSFFYFRFGQWMSMMQAKWHVCLDSWLYFFCPALPWLIVLQLISILAQLWGGDSQLATKAMGCAQALAVAVGNPVAGGPSKKEA